MDDLAVLRSHIEAYADYTDESSRHLVDKQIRAWVGEALARVRERLAPQGELGEQLEGLIFRCEFSDQRAIRAGDHASMGDALIAHIHGLDRQIVEAANSAAGIELDRLGEYLANVVALFDQRFGAIISADMK
jgi:hypothetical protein